MAFLPSCGVASGSGGTAADDNAIADGGESTPDNTDGTYTFTDDSGGEVTVGLHPKKVAVLFSSYADIWVTAGGEIAVTVGEAVERGFADEGCVLVDESAGHSSVDLEALIAAEPDFVIGTADYECQTEAVALCRDAGIPAAVFRVESFDDYLRVLGICCALTGDSERYEQYGVKVGERVASMLAAASAYGEGKRDILFIRAGSSAKSTKAKTSDDNFVCAMLAELNTNNIADGGGLGDSLSLEAIIDADPEIMFITTMGDESAAVEYMTSLLDSEGWRELTCVADGEYYFLPKEMFHFKPNSRWADAYAYLIAILYPELDLGT